MDKASTALIRDLVLQANQAFRLGLRDFFVDLLADDVKLTLHSPPEILPTAQRLNGKAEVLAAIQSADAVFEILGSDVVMLVVENETAAAVFERRLRVRATGREISHRLAVFQRFRQGRIVEYDLFMDGVAILEQALGRKIDLLAL